MKLEIIRSPLTYGDIKPGEYVKTADPTAGDQSAALVTNKRDRDYGTYLVVEASGTVKNVCGNDWKVIRCSGFSGIPTTEQAGHKNGEVKRFDNLPVGAVFCRCSDNLIYFKDEMQGAYCPASGRVEIVLEDEAVQELADVTLTVRA